MPARKHHAKAAKRPKTAKPEASSKEYKSIKVLVLEWEYTDLDPLLRQERDRVIETFRKLGFNTKLFLIGLKDDSKEKLLQQLQKFLDVKKKEEKTLRILYYHGHGYIDENKDEELILFSHNKTDVDRLKHRGKAILDLAKEAETIGNNIIEFCRDQSKQTLDPGGKHERDKFLRRLNLDCGWQLQQMVSIVSKQIENIREEYEIAWSDMQQPILDAPCDMVIILDCCHAGAVESGISGSQKLGSYDKRVLVASHEKTFADGSMSRAMCEFLMREKQKGTHFVTVSDIYDGVKDKPDNRTGAKDVTVRQLQKTPDENPIKIPLNLKD